MAKKCFNINSISSLLTLYAFFLFFSTSLLSQDPFPDPGPVFRDDVIPRVDIIIPQDSLEELFAPGNEDSYHHYLADFIFDNGDIRDTIEDVGFRFRGNTSRHSQKKSYKISFNTYEKGRKFYGIEKMNLNGEHNDPSVIRSKLCWDLLREMGVPAPRANHIDLYVNGSFFGIYINVEHIDEEFVNSRFGNNNGNLYKCLWPADLNYLGSNPDLYKKMAGDRRVYDLRTNTAEDDYTDLAHFIGILNNTSMWDIPCELEKVLNVDNILRAIAFDILSGNWDGPHFNKNNFYLYRNTDNGKFEYIPYDLDNTFGIDWFNIDWARRNIYNWGNENESRPLFYKVISHPEYRNRLSYYLDLFVKTIYNETYLYPYVDEIRSSISPSIMDDPFRPLDYGFSFQDFMNSYNTELDANHVKFGLKPFFSIRMQSTIDQLEDANISPIISDVKREINYSSGSIEVSAKVVDDSGLDWVRVCFSGDQSTYECIDMLDNGSFPDLEAGDNIFTAAVSVDDFSGNFYYYVQAMDDDGFDYRNPYCTDLSIEFGETNKTLVINELMADNKTIIADEYGEYDDWVELYNAGTGQIFLGDKYVTDDQQNPLKWKLPNIWIQSGEFLLFWADDDEEDQGDMHLSFKLSKDGEYFGVYDIIGLESVLLDGVFFGKQEEDISFGRLPDGEGDFDFLNPSPGAPNMPLGLEEVNTGNTLIFPNPSADRITIKSLFALDKIQIFDEQGKLFYQEMKRGQKEFSLLVKTWKPGTYLIRLTGGGHSSINKLLIN